MRILLFAILIFLSSMLYGQELYQCHRASALHYSVVTGGEEIDFLKIGTDTLSKKPALIFLQGSLPVPLIIDYGSSFALSSFPFDVSPLLERYHLYILSKPYVPLVKSIDSLHNGAIYNDPTGSYNKSNHLDTYINRTDGLIDYLLKQSFIDDTKLVLFGHSEGSTVAIKMYDNKYVTHIAVASSNPLGRIYQGIAELRLQEDMGRLSSEEVQSQIQGIYDRWSYISSRKEDTTADRGDTFKATFSFSEYLIDDMIQMAQPLLIIYGTRDIGARSCDYVPIALTRAGKTNYTMLPFIGRGHNFESQDDMGNPNYDDMAWDQVIYQLIDWAY